MSTVVSDYFDRPCKKITKVFHSSQFMKVGDDTASYDRIKTRLRHKASLQERHMPDKINIQKDWIRRHKENEELEFALLQRITCLERVKRQKEEEQPASSLIHTPGPSNPKRQVTLAEEHYFRCQRASRALDYDKPSGSLTDEFDFLRHHRNSDGQTLAWEEDRIACALLGGCCGRRCRCCERPLRCYIMPDSGEGKEMVGFHGHCTAECGCCMRHRGFYRPDSRLKALDPELATKIAVFNKSHYVEEDSAEEAGDPVADALAVVDALKRQA
ncbi:hypothetical protein BO70DRAFT_392161 [Aspergillus heteromorphus CBS 117.55]|uniref:Uncharacterized protein n=1 Tax=Aspergillus heteromorphus CBS 117.55 TaxID=1448321 RepID=A0A317X5G0_9EURO|nr:uncharacterized protein BO70DRAFT_392161 [Aspergillus heteromorphus CBS 117.55]PWY92777.1 hypothetical protein BO70DRAFT_392161 [Aspergillus heteromorphus CBS 117.55]